MSPYVTSLIIQDSKGFQSFDHLYLVLQNLLPEFIFTSSFKCSKFCAGQFVKCSIYQNLTSRGFFKDRNISQRLCHSFDLYSSPQVIKKCAQSTVLYVVVVSYYAALWLIHIMIWLLHKVQWIAYISFWLVVSYVLDIKKWNICLCL